MLELEQTSPNLDTAFKSELRVVRRSDRFWSGLSTDLAIEQALMSRPFSGDELTQQINHIHIFKANFCSVILAKGVFKSLYAFFQSFHGIVFSEFYKSQFRYSLQI
jgi:hypothetical protein